MLTGDCALDDCATVPLTEVHDIPIHNYTRRHSVVVEQQFTTTSYSKLQAWSGIKHVHAHIHALTHTRMGTPSCLPLQTFPPRHRPSPFSHFPCINTALPTTSLSCRTIPSPLPASLHELRHTIGPSTTRSTDNFYGNLMFPQWTVSRI